ncbi:MAG: CHC2 zinc finger domain-containing protein [Candidatus Anammoxibacter sp.]
MTTVTFTNIKENAEYMQVDLQWALETRKRYLSGVMALCHEAINGIVKSLAGKHSLARELYFLWINEFQEKVDRCMMQVALLKPQVTGVENSGNGITGELIETAKEYPIENLLPNPVKRNLTLCFAHNDKHPSMSIKNNKVKCFACGYSGSVIDVVMHLNKCDFKKAVKFINNQN